MAEARASLTHLPEIDGSGIFLANGGRMSVDPAGQLIVETPECREPGSAVLYVRAGERAILDLADRVDGPGSVAVEKVAAGWQETFFTRSRRRLGTLRNDLVPYLASRIVRGGAGGFDPTDPSLRFVLSPSAFLYDSKISAAVTSGPAPWHAGNRRGALGEWVRIAFGENLRSDLAAIASVGATALVVQLATRQDGLHKAPALRRPLDAWRTISADTACTARLRLVDGRSLTAIEIQRSYLEQVERRLASLPDWAPEHCERWRSELDRLGRQSPSAAVEWAERLAYLERRIRAEPNWPALTSWNGRWGDVVAEVETPGLQLDEVGRGNPLEAALVQWASARSASVEDLLRYARLRRDLLGQDRAMRLVESDRSLSPGALFDQSEIERALEVPPPDTRAALRGKWVKRLGRTADRARFRCDWEGLRDLVAGTWLDLSDPSATTAEWQSPSRRSGQGDLFSNIRDWLNWDF